MVYFVNVLRLLSLFSWYIFYLRIAPGIRKDERFPRNWLIISFVLCLSYLGFAHFSLHDLPNLLGQYLCLLIVIWVGLIVQGIMHIENKDQRKKFIILTSSIACILLIIFVVLVCANIIPGY